MLEGILPREGRTGALTKPGTKGPVVRGWGGRYSQPCSQCIHLEDLVVWACSKSQSPTGQEVKPLLL